MILTKGQPGISTNKGYRLRIESSNVVEFRVTGDTELAAVSTNTITSGQWYHVVGVKDSANIKLYVNGEIWANNTAPAGTTNNSVNLQIGRDSSSQ